MNHKIRDLGNHGQIQENNKVLYHYKGSGGEARMICNSISSCRVVWGPPPKNKLKQRMQEKPSEVSLQCNEHKIEVII